MATEPRNPAFRESPNSRQFPPSTHSLPIRSSSSPPKSPHQQDVRIRSPHGQEHEGYGSRPGGRGGRAPNFRRGGRWREKAPKNRMTGENAIGESSSYINGSVQPNGHMGVIEQQEQKRLPKGKNVDIGNVTMQGKKPDPCPVVETFVGRWGEEPSASKESYEAEEGYVNVPSLVNMTKIAFAASSNNRGRQRRGRAGRMVENRSKPHGSSIMESAIPFTSSFTSTPHPQTHDGVPRTWRSKPGNAGITSKQHAQEFGKLLSGALNDGDDSKVAVLQKAERIGHDLQIDLEDGVLSPSFTNLKVRETGMKMKNVEGGCWGDHGWGDREALANGPSGWDDFVKTTTQTQRSKKWESKGFAYDGGLNMSDFDCCDTEVKILGKKVLVTVAATAGTIEKWMQEHQGERRFGFDIEWKPTKQKGDYSDAAILQLSIENHCLLVQLLFLDHFPECLKNLLADSTVVLGGVGIKADAKKLKDDHGLVCEGVVELGEMAAQAFQDKVLQTAGLVTLTDKVLGATHKKNRRATMSNWEIRDLTFEQIQYAATDAWLSYHLLMALCTLKENPPPPVKKPSEPARIRVADPKQLIQQRRFSNPETLNPKPYF